MTITNNNTGTIKAIKNCIGKVVSEVARVQYYFNDQEDDEDFGDLEIKFTDNTYLTLTGIGDAESIKAENKEAEIYDAYNVTDNDVASWKRLDLKADREWNKIIGQILKTAEVEWNIYENNEDKITACILKFETDFVSFYETNSDNNRFYVNQPIPKFDGHTRTDRIT